MEEENKNIRNIPIHIKRWYTFAIVAPPVFLTVGLLLLMSDMVEFGTLFWIGASIMAITAFSWWIWIILVIYILYQHLNLTKQDINIIIHEVVNIRTDINKDVKDGKSN
jgi:cell division protein FtsW (lipid II flippase)